MVQCITREFIIYSIRPLSKRMEEIFWLWFLVCLHQHQHHQNDPRSLRCLQDETSNNVRVVDLKAVGSFIEFTPDASEVIMWLGDIFRAKVVDTTEYSLTIEVTGDPGKMVTVQRNLDKFGIKELTRTGKGDVYPVEYYNKFSMNQVLDPHWGVLYEEDLTGHKSHTVNILVNNALGVLNLVIGVISRKGYNIQWIKVFFFRVH
ncbi:unnamed protein product [Lactuca saligna]|uniref:Acetolactate synthase small subunit C-terminal domain-containing protein n=1 Tax=Lactuca saligna TaxID=75948 RepID=A0AA36E5G0_LACSI|nr:unnamed protein product [Lactuca saligna]